MKNIPLLSVCIPAYNPGDYLRPAIDSVLKQDFDDYELIIVDDCSAVPLQGIIEEFRDPRLTLHRNECNLGLVENWNRCLQMARGQYTTIFHQDDIMHPTNLAAKVAMLIGNPNVGFVYSNIETIDASNDITGGHWLPQPLTDGIEPGLSVFERLALTGNFIACPTVMMRASCYRELGDFDPRLPFTCDMEMWMRIASRYDVGYLAAPLVAYRFHANQETNRFRSGGREIREVKRALDIAFTEHAPVGFSPQLRRKAKWNLMRWAFRMAKWEAGRRHIRSALGYAYASIYTMLTQQTT